MQQLGTKTLTVDGVTVFSDHADPNQFWYLPAPVALGKRALDGRPAFTMIKWRPAAVTAGAKGGGFATFEVNLKLPEDTERSIRAQARSLPGVTGAVRLSAIPFDEGTVRCIALDLEGSGGTSAPANAPPGTFRAVETIRGVAQPSLAGNNTAAFSLTLTQEGAIILEQAFAQGTTPVGAVYDLKYSILRPALSVIIKANYEDIYQHFSAGLEAQVYWVKAGIDAGFEKMVSEGVIDIEVIDFTGEEDKADKEQWALDFFKDNLLAKWFEPSISPADVESRMAKPESLDAVMRRAREMNPTPPATTQPGQPGQPGTPGTSQRQAATLVVARSPEPPPAGQNLRLEPGSTGDEEKLIVEGPAGWTATVGGAPAVVRDGKIVLNVPGGGAAQTVSVVWPQSGGGGGGTVPPAPTTRQFKLFFEKDKPLAADLAASTALYVNNRTPDVRFKTASGPVNEPAPPGGAQGSDLFRAWLDTLPSPRIINFEGNASFEQFPPGQDPLGTPADRETHDINLSRRRIDVARACMQGRGTFGRSIAKGHADAEAQGNLDRPEDRHVLCTWVGSGTPPPPPPPPPNVPEVRVTGTIQRPAPVITPGTPGTPGTPPGTGTTPPAIPSVPVPSSMPALVSFKLKFVQKEERKSVTLRYHRTEAVQRTYAPQGFIGLMLGEIDDLSKHFVEVDLDHPFFRNFEVTVDAPVDYARIGLNAIQVAVDYGDPANPATLKHEDMVFDPTTPTQATFTTFMSPALDLAYTASTQFHFAPEQATGWMGERLSYEIPAVQTIDRTLMVTPHEHLGFIEVSVIANRIDAEMVDRIVVDLRFEDPSGWVATKTMIVRAGDASQPWKVRTSSPDARAYSYVLTHHLKDGNPPVVDDPVISTANAVAVDDPFPDALDLDLIPMWDPAQVRMVFVDVTYTDADNGIERAERVQFKGEDQDVQRLRMTIRNRKAREFGWKALFVLKDGGRFERPMTLTTETLVELSM